MNILLDGHFLDKKKEGSRTFIYSYLEGLAKLEKSDPELIQGFSFTVPVFYPGDWQAHFATLKNVRFVKTFRNAMLRNHVDLPMQAARFSASALQSVYYLPVWLPKAVKKILVIHDVLPFTHPEYFSKYFRCKFRNLLGISQRQADRIVCGSVFSKTAIQGVFQIEEQRIRVIPYGIHLDRFAAGPAAESMPDFRAGFPSSPFILVVGRLDPRKGLRFVLELFNRLPRESDIRLVLVGSSDALPGAEARTIASLQAVGRLHWFQNISDDALTCLYRRAKLLLFFPATEGFGLPVLEAMAAGIPYLTVPQGGLKEIAIAESWVDAQNPEQTLRQAGQLLHDEELRKRFVQKGHAQVQKFRCEDMVRQYLRLYRECK